MKISNITHPDRLHKLADGINITTVPNLEAGSIYFLRDDAGEPHLYAISKDRTPVEIGIRTSGWEGSEAIQQPRYIIEGTVIRATFTETILVNSGMNYKWFLPDGDIALGNPLDTDNHDDVDENSTVYLQAFDSFGNESNFVRIDLSNPNSGGSGGTAVANRPASIDYLHDGADLPSNVITLNKPMNANGTLPVHYELDYDDSLLEMAVLKDYGDKVSYAYTHLVDPLSGEYSEDVTVGVTYVATDGNNISYTFNVSNVGSTVNNGAGVILPMNTDSQTDTELVVLYHAITEDGGGGVINSTPADITTTVPSQLTLVQLKTTPYYSIYKYTVQKDEFNNYYPALAIESEWIDPDSGDTVRVHYNLPADGPGGTNGGNGGNGSSTGNPTNRNPAHNLPASSMTFASGTFELTLPTDAGGIADESYVISTNSVIFVEKIEPIDDAKHLMEYNVIDSDGGHVDGEVDITWDNHSLHMSVVLVNATDPVLNTSGYNVDSNSGKVHLSVTALGTDLVIETHASDVDGSTDKLRVIGLDHGVMRVKVGHMDTILAGSSFTLEVLENADSYGTYKEFEIVRVDALGNYSNPVTFRVTMPSTVWDDDGLIVHVPANPPLATNFNVSLSATQAGHSYKIVDLSGLEVIEGAGWQTSGIWTLYAETNAQKHLFSVIAKFGNRELSGRKFINFATDGGVVHPVDTVFLPYEKSMHVNEKFSTAVVESRAYMMDSSFQVFGEKHSHNSSWILDSDDDNFYNNYNSSPHGSIIFAGNTWRDLIKLPEFVNHPRDGVEMETDGSLIVSYEDWDIADNLISRRLYVADDLGNALYYTPDLSNETYKSYRFTAAQLVGGSEICMEWVWRSRTARNVYLRTPTLPLTISPITSPVTEPYNKSLHYDVKMYRQEGVNQIYGGPGGFTKKFLGLRTKGPDIGVMRIISGNDIRFPFWEHHEPRYNDLDVINTNDLIIKMYNEQRYAQHHALTWKISNLRVDGVFNTTEFQCVEDDLWGMGEEVRILEFGDGTGELYTFTIDFRIGGKRMQKQMSVRMQTTKGSTDLYPVHDITNQTYNVPRGEGEWLIRARGAPYGGAQNGAFDTLVHGLRPTPLRAEAGWGSNLGPLVVERFVVTDENSFYKVYGTAMEGGWCTIQRIS